jgi:hypothetical protein
MEQQKVEKQKISLTTEPVNQLFEVDQSVIESNKKIVTYDFEFPCGVINSKGEICKNFKLSPMTGKTRKIIGDIKYRNNLVKIGIMILKDTLISIEGITQINDFVLNNMLPGDKDFAFLMLKKISMPLDYKKIILKGKCQNQLCNSDMELELDIENDFNVKKIDEKLNQNIIQINNSFQRVITEEDKNFGKLTIRLQNVNDQEIISQVIQQNPIEAEHLLLSRLILDYNGNKKMTESDFDSLSFPEIEWIENCTTKHHYGVNLTRKVKCWNCNTENTLTIDLLNFLFQRSRSN